MATKLSPAKQRALTTAGLFSATKNLQWTDAEIAGVAACSFDRVVLEHQAKLTRLPPFRSKVRSLTLLDLPELTSLAGIETHGSLVTLTIDSDLLALPKSWHHLAELPELTKLVIVRGAAKLGAGIERLPSLLALDVDDKAMELAFMRSLPATIRELKLGASKIDSAAIEPLRRLAALTRLELICPRRMTELPDAVFACKTLEQLRVVAPRLASLSANIQQLTALVKLDVEKTAITALPPELGHLAKLRELVVPSGIETPPKQLHALKLQSYSRGSWAGADLPLAEVEEPDDTVDALTIDDVSRVPASFGNVKHLALEFAGQRVPALKQLATAKRLRHLEVTCDSLAPLLPHIPKHLTQLTVRAPSITKLPDLPDLESLLVTTLTGPLDLGRYPKLKELGVGIGKRTATVKNLHRASLGSLTADAGALRLSELAKIDTLWLVYIMKLTDAQFPGLCKALAGNQLELARFSGKQLTELAPEIGLLAADSIDVRETGVEQLTAALGKVKGLTSIVWPPRVTVDTKVLGGRWRTKKRASETTITRS